MTRWIRYVLQDVEDGQGGGAGGAAGATVAEEPSKPGEPKAPEPRPWQKKLGEIRDGKKPTDATDPGKKPENSVDPGKPPTDEGKSPGPVQTPKDPAKPDPAAKTGDEKKGDDPKGEQKPDAKAKGEEKEGDDGEKAETVKLALPGRNKGEKDATFKLPRKALEEAGVDVQQLSEGIARLRKGYLRGEQLLPAKEEIAQQREELQEIEEELKTDPVSFVAQRIEKPELQEKVVERLLAELPDEAFDRVLETAAKLAKDPTKRENERLKRRVAERDRDDAKNRRGAERKADLSVARKIGEQIAAVMSETDLGEDVDSPRAERFFDYAIASIARHAQKNKITNLDPSTVPELLEQLGVLEDFGLSRKKKRAAKPKDDGQGPSADGEQDPRERDRRRREATTVPSGGGAAAPTGERPPKGQTFKERIGWLRKNKT